MTKTTMTATDDQIRAMLDAKHSTREVAKRLKCGLLRVRRIRDGGFTRTRMEHRDAVFAWIESHDVTGMLVGDLVEQIASELGIARTTARRWEREWRKQTGAPPVKVGRLKTAVPEHSATDPRPISAVVEPVADVPEAPEAFCGDSVMVPQHYLEALEAVVILTHMLHAARQA